MTGHQHISIDILALLWTGKTYNAIRMMIQRGKIKDVKWLTKKEAIKEGLQWKEGGGGGKNGKRPFISIDDPAIPAEVKARYFKTDSETTVGDMRPFLQVQGQVPASLAPALINQNQDNPTSAGDKALTDSFRSGSAENRFLYFPTQGQETSAGSLAPTFFSEKAKVIGKARLDLLKAWRDYRAETPLKKGKADNEFLDAYNRGIIFPNLFESLDEVSRQTLYNWQAALDGTQDWIKLIPQYYDRGNEGPELSDYEQKQLLSLLLHPNKNKIGTACRLAKFALEKKGHPTDKSGRTFRRFAEKYKKEHYDIWVLMREGQKALRDKVEPFIKRDPSVLEVGDVLVADGHRLNFRVINPFTGKPCRATLIGYIDWKSYDLAGYEIMVEENTQSIASALRNSILRLGRIPKVSYQDNGKAFKSRFFTRDINLEECGIYGLFGRLGIVPAFATPYNARAKIIERWFKEFSDSFERLTPSFTGANINDKPAWMLRNEKFHKALHDGYVPTIDEADWMIEAWLGFHRSQPCPHVKGKTIKEVWDEGIEAQKHKHPEINIQALDDLMMAIEIKNIRRNGIRFLNADYYNESFYGMRDKVLIKYSLFNLSYIKVYEMNGQFLCAAERVESVHPMAAALGNANDVATLKNALSVQRRLERQTIKLTREHIKINGTAPQLDWQFIGEKSPKVIEQLSAENISLPGDERRISNDELIHAMYQAAEEFNGKSEGLPIFSYEWERYEYLLKQPELSDDDRQWIDEYRKSIEQANIAEVKEGEIVRLMPPARPHFNDNFERYDWHLKNGLHTDKDEEWVEWYKTTNEYRMLYVTEEDNEIFKTAWDRYEFLVELPYKGPEDFNWINDFRGGKIYPGEYEEGCRIRDLKKAVGGNE